LSANPQAWTQFAWQPDGSKSKAAMHRRVNPTSEITCQSFELFVWSQIRSYRVLNVGRYRSTHVAEHRGDLGVRLLHHCGHEDWEVICLTNGGEEKVLYGIHIAHSSPALMIRVQPPQNPMICRQTAQVLALFVAVLYITVRLTAHHTVRRRQRWSTQVCSTGG
jgi:hypothetical protein